MIRIDNIKAANFIILVPPNITFKAFKSTAANKENNKVIKIV